MPSECSLSRRRGSLLRHAQDGELAEPQPRWDWRRLRTCATREGGLVRRSCFSSEGGRRALATAIGAPFSKLMAGRMPLAQVLEQSLNSISISAVAPLAASY